MTATDPQNVLANVYITALGKHLPGAPVTNDEMEDRLGRIHGQPSRARKRVLKQNGIQTRHYAIGDNQQSLSQASTLAAKAIVDAIQRSTINMTDVDYLAAATTQGDLCVPGFASAVHGEIGVGPWEIASLGGVCASGMAALKSAYLQVRADGKRNAVACAGELPSRLFKASRYEAHLPPGTHLPFDVEFLRWMLSDGGGAALLQPQPAPQGHSLKLEWIHSTSHAHALETCMYAGALKRADGRHGPSWLDYPTYEAAAAEGALYLRQDIRLLDNIVKLGIDTFFELVEDGRVVPQNVDHFVCHYSSNIFREKILTLLNKAGAPLPEEKWFSNLTHKGNVGSASLFVLLEELFNDGNLKPGQQVLAMVPESGRFQVSFALFTVVGAEQDALPPATVRSNPSNTAASNVGKTSNLTTSALAGPPCPDGHWEPFGGQPHPSAHPGLDRLRDQTAQGSHRFKAGIRAIYCRRLPGSARQLAPAGRRGLSMDCPGRLQP